MRESLASKSRPTQSPGDWFIRLSGSLVSSDDVHPLIAYFCGKDGR